MGAGLDHQFETWINFEKQELLLRHHLGDKVDIHGLCIIYI